MPLQNRVTPTGDIIATPHRGLFTGNRGIIHDTHNQDLAPTRRWASQAWLTCVCGIQGTPARGDGRSQLDRAVLSRRGATAFAAGHRPCFFCRRDDANRFRAAWGRAMASPMLARDIDAGAPPRAALGTKKRLHARTMALEELPDGAMLQEGPDELSDRAGPGAIRGRWRVIARRATRSTTRCC